jgi:transcriptional regulator with GAF, ATPase, and Fis domain
MSSNSEILAATLPEARYETLIRVSNAIGTYRDPQDLFRTLVRELHRVVQFDSVGVSIYDEKSNAFHRNFVDAVTEASIPPDPELKMEESDAWWFYQNQEPMVTSLTAQDAEVCKFREILKKYGIRSVCTLPLTTAHSKVGALTLQVKLRITIPPKKFTFFQWWLSRSLSPSTMRCILMRRRPHNSSCGRRASVLDFSLN